MSKLKGFEPVAWRCTHGGEMYHFAYATPNPSDWDTCIPLYTADQLAAVVQQRDELLKHRDALLIDLAASLDREDERIRERDELARAASAKVQP